MISEIETEYNNLTKFKETNYRRKTATMISALLSIFTAMATFLFSLIPFVDKDIFNKYNFSNEYEVSFVIILCTIVLVFSLFAIIPIMDKLKDERKSQSEKKEKKEKK